VDEPISRSLMRAGVELVGPKLFRIYGGEDSGRTRYKNVIEPRFGYEYRTSDPDQDEILPFDEVDTLNTASNQIFYGLRSRLFARRPRAEIKDLELGERPVTMDLERTGGSLNDVDPGAAAAQAETAKDAAAKAEQPQEPVEILSLEFRQFRSLNTDLRTEDLDGDGVFDRGEDLDGDGFFDPGEDLDGDGFFDRGEDTDGNGMLDRSRYSTLEMIGRFNPGPAASVDLRGSWDPLFDQLSELSVSGNLYSPTARSAFSIVRRAGVGALDETRTQFRVAAGVALWSGKVRFDAEGTYDLEVKEVPDQRYRVEFYTQCCGFLADYLQRDFTALTRREFRFTVDLRGIGRLFDLHESTE
jgi:hypothetical protein